MLELPNVLLDIHLLGGAHHARACQILTKRAQAISSMLVPSFINNIWEYSA